jgi:hypothetical protein
MAAVSGQITFYHFNFQNTNGSRAVDGIEFRTSRSSILHNRVTLLISPSDTIEAKIFHPTPTYVTEKLRYLGKYLVEWNAPERKVSFNNPRDARTVIENLYQHGDILIEDRERIARVLLELEKCVQYADNRLDVISVAQKDIIKEFVAPYIEIIKAETTDIQILKEWLSSTRAGLTRIRPHFPANFMARWIGPNEEFNPLLEKDLIISKFIAYQCNLQDKSQEFYQSLIALTKTYYSMADLENALEQLGDGLPTEELIQQTILESFNNTSQTENSGNTV